MGFPSGIINWIMNLYKNIQSICLINGYLTNPFNIERGIRQGCPLSMIMYVIFQEPLYNAIENSTKILPPVIKGKQIKILGYADDTTGFMKDDGSIVEFFNVIKKIENATNSRINIRKTKIFGYGGWKNRTNWPIKEIKVEVDHFKTLGINFSTNYKLAVELTWTNIYNKICKRINMIRNRYFTLYQKACIVNSLLASKIWYTAHVYPFPMKTSKMIEKEIYRFIWNSNKDSIQRDVLCSSKENGGIGLINIFTKAKSILIATTIKILMNADNDTLI